VNWFEARDNYCERLDASFWAEPVNAITNFLFILFAIVIFIRNKKSNDDKNTKRELNVLSALLVLIGLGSFSFHTYANRLTEMFDILGIIFFVITYLFFVLKRAFSFSTLKRIVIIVGLFIVTIVLSAIIPDSIFNGSHIYFPVLAMFLWIVVGMKTKRPKYFSDVRLALIVFFISIVFRTLDSLICDLVPLGTHFLWHSLNAIMFYILLRNYRASH
jgi:hypothetical protein